MLGLKLMYSLSSFLFLQFVAHPSCQKKLTSMWYSSCEWLKNRSWTLRMAIIILIALVYPVLAIVYMVAPRSKVSIGQGHRKQRTRVSLSCSDFCCENTVLSSQESLLNQWKQSRHGHHFFPQPVVKRLSCWRSVGFTDGTTLYTNPGHKH